jgi:hypothetical protein
MKLRIFLLVLVFLQGCASTQGIVAKKVADGSKIFVASKMGNEFSFRRVGTTAFNNSTLNIKVESWGVDHFIENETISNLSSHYTAESNSDISNKISIPSVNFVTGYPNEFTEKNGLNILKEKGYQYVLIITPVNFQDAFFGTNQFIEGFGFYQRSFMGSSTALLYTQVSFSLFDLTSRKFISSNGDTGSNGGNAPWVGHMKLINEPSVNEKKPDLNSINKYKINILDLFKDRVMSSVAYMGFKLGKRGN